MSAAAKDAPEQAQTKFGKDQLKAFVERIERLEEEKKTISDDVRDVYAEAKGNGFDTKALRAIIKLRAQDANERAEHEAILDTYMSALGMLPFDAPRPDSRPSGERLKDDDTRIVIEVAGMPPVETTMRGLQQASAAAKTPAGRDSIKRAVARAEQGGRAEDLVNPKTKPSNAAVKAIADRAEARSQDQGGNGGSSPPPSSAPPSDTPPAAAAPASASPVPRAPESISAQSVSPATGETVFVPGPSVSAPHACAPPPSEDFQHGELEIPPILKRGDPACYVQTRH